MSGRRTILITGAAGVVGRALIRELSEHRVVCLLHRATVGAAPVKVVHGNVGEPRLGLAAGEYRRLAAEVDSVVHAAAITNFAQPEDLIFATNVGGTQNALEFAEAACAPLYHVSTAFVHPLTHVERGVPADAYQRSKQRAEAVVRESGLPSVILRPSMIVGDSRTGEIAQFQGFHMILGLYLQGYLPVVPAASESLIDFVAQDYFARVVRALVERDCRAGEFWVTAGERALTWNDMAELTVQAGERVLGRTLVPPRFVPPDTFERLIRPVFVPALPPRVRQTLERAISFSRYLNIDRPFPTSLPELAGWLELPDPPERSVVYARNFEYWLSATGFVRKARRREAQVA